MTSTSSGAAVPVDQQVGAGTIALTLGLTSLVQVVSSLVALSVPVLAPAIAADLHLNGELIGYYPGIMYSAALAACIVGEPLSSRCGPMARSLIAVAISVAGLGLLLVGVTPVFALAALVIGIGYGPVVPATSQILSTQTPRKYSNLIFSFKQTAAPMGGILAGLLVPLLIGLSGDWSGAIHWLIAGSVVALVLMIPFAPRFDRMAVRATSSGMMGPIRAVLSHGSLRRLVMMSSCYGGMQLCLGAFLTLYMVKVVGLGLVEGGMIFGAAQGASVVGRLLWGYVADRFLSPAPLMVALGVAMAVGAVLVTLCGPETPMWLLIVISVFYGGTAMGWNGVLIAETARLSPPGQVSLMTSGVMSANFAGVIVGPLFFSLIAGLFDTLRAGFIAMAILTVFCASFGLVQRRA